ncbi:GNAT family N-acetyltransferase [Paenibacillus sp. Marseille-Q4541]|uniref:GNAT family N-acetyltransferase n=1 Tax=Paenibacillus sp. Marseille-Q4541 TaxID=2831522 RepID=UPI001BAD57A0|nr:GNAT family N-acetyltransferase [Paenibacillus sp. Marseille-Q4541]
MEYIRIVSIENPLFVEMHQLMQQVFPPEEVLDFPLWEEPLKDPGIRVFVAVSDDKVVGATEYRYYEDWNVAMTDFTIIGQDGLGIGPFLAAERKRDLNRLAETAGKELFGMFAEIYNPYLSDEHDFGGIKSMNPYVRREVLSHLGYKRIDFPYVHPSWQGDGEAVSGLDLCFMPSDASVTSISSRLVADFLKRYYMVLPVKPAQWTSMVEDLESREELDLKRL